MHAARRGSILVLVVGVVALMAIIVVVYASLGQGDRRRAEALSKAAKLGDQSVAVGDYLAGVVARGAFKTQPVQRVLPTLPALRQRFAADYPSIDPSLVFDPTDTTTSGISNPKLQQALRYAPSGSVEAAWDTGAGAMTGPDPRFPFDAFLAANQPANLRFGGDPASIDAAIRDKPYVADRDWRMISNASPDGRFVNLATIRNNFDAVSGVGLANNAQSLSATNRPRTTYDLTLLNDADDPGTPGSPMTQLNTPWPTLNLAVVPWAYEAGGANEVSQWRANVNEANQPGKYFPADFTANQVGMFIPLTDTRPGTARIDALARFYTETKPANLSPGDQEYLPNQYADADGDGLIDSRWFELVDASTPGVPARSLIPTDPNLRLFVATRIIDLSAKVNVNTASSFASEPDALTPAGATPADIDLERLLTMRGAYSEAMPVSGQVSTATPPTVLGYGPGYQDMAQPSGPPVTWPSGKRIGDYNNYASAGATSMVPGFTAVGSSAYAALLDTLVRGTQTAAGTPTATGWVSPVVPDKTDGTYPPGYIRPFEYGKDASMNPIMFFLAGTELNTTAPGPIERLRAADRRFLFSRGSGAGAELASSGLALRSGIVDKDYVPTLDAGGQFGLADELELRARERVNDPRRRSRLEETLSGRNVEFPRFSPLRDDRSLEIETLARDRTTAAYIPGGPAGAAVVQPDGKPDPSAYLQAKVDVRQHLTTVSGARPLASTVLAAGAEKKLSPGELKIDVNAALADIQRAAQQVDMANKPAPNWALMQQGIDAIYSGAVGALLPYASENDNANAMLGSRIAWDASGSTAGAAGLTLNYAGGRNTPSATMPVANNSAEVALRAAAHWTANLIASRQTFRPGVNANDPPEAADRPVMFAVPLGGQFVTEKTGYARKTMFGGPRNTRPVVDVVPFGATDNLNDFPAAFAAQVFTGVNAGGAKAPRVAGRLDADAGIAELSDSWPAADTAAQRLAPRLPSDPVTGRPPNMSTAGLTVFGITPQPFITQAAIISMYAAKKVTGADACDAVNGYKLKIGGPTDASNKSYLFEAMSVQLHNPFDCEIALGGCVPEPTTGRVIPRPSGAAINPEDITYYVEFGGRIYGLAKYDDQSGTMVAPGVLRPGESRTFYFVDQTFAEIAQRFMAADPAYSGDQTAVKTFIEGQFYDATNLPTGATRLPPLDYATMQVRTSFTKLGIAGPYRGTDDAVASADTDKDRVVRLWRVQRNALASDPLARSHDMLVDRLRDPETGARSTFNRQFKGDPVTGQVGYVCIEVAGASTPDYGPAMLFWGSVRRPHDNAAGIGALPLYCVESKSISLSDPNVSDPYRRKMGHKSINASFADEHAEPQGTNSWILDLDQISETNLTANSIAPGVPQTLHRPVASKLNPLVTTIETFRTSQSLRVIPEADVNPTTFRSTAAGYGNASVPSLPAAAAVATTLKPAGGLISEDRVTLPMMLPVPTDPTGLSRAPGPIGSAVPATPLTPMQLLTVPAFGPYNDPEALMGTAGPFADYTDKVQLNVQWTTLAEAAALAMGFDAAEQPTSPEYGFAGLSSGGTVEVEPVLKRGRLRTDAFFPFLDKATGGRVFDGRDSLPRNQRVPLALGLLDRFSTLSRSGTLTRSTPGVVNINTAPLEVLRLVPMLSPDFAPGFGTFYAGESAGAWPAHAAFLDASFTEPWFNPETVVWDTAAMVAAYRDKSAVRIRPLADRATGLPVAEATNSAVPIFANFRDDSVQTTPTAVPNAPMLRPAGRSVWTQTPLARETPGFASVGELLAVRYGLDAPVAGGGGVVGALALSGPAQMPLQSSSIDRFAKVAVMNQRATPMLPAPRGVDHQTGDAGNRAISGFGTTSVRLAGTPLTRGVLVPPLPDRDTAIADAVANTVSVRSDLFCVWFVLHGYQPKDVEGLRPTDPMTPSVARRFVMVVDRSNVVSLGQKPRILMLEEVPYN